MYPFHDTASVLARKIGLKARASRSLSAIWTGALSESSKSGAAARARRVVRLSWGSAALDFPGFGLVRARTYSSRPSSRGVSRAGGRRGESRPGRPQALVLQWLARSAVAPCSSGRQPRVP